jgi:putative inorganic carbon (hco3(-)) transporter
VHDRPLTVAPTADRWLFGALLVLVCWLPLPWGSKPAAASASLGLVTAILVAWRLTLMLRGHTLPPLPKAARTALWLWCGWLGWLTLHVVPLPSGVIGALSPRAGELHDATSRIIGDGWLTLSILPGATIEQIQLSAAYIGVFWLALVTIARNRQRQRGLILAVVCSGFFQALFGSVMTLSGLEYGFLEQKAHNLGVATGTFVNRNHYAAYLELTLAAGIALILSDLRAGRSRTWRQFLGDLVELAMSRRVQVRIMLVVMVIALVLSRSRGGNLAFFLALAVCGSVYVVLRHPKYLLKSFLFFLSLFAVDLLIVSEHYGLQKLAQRIEETVIDTEQRSIAIRDLEPSIRDYWLTGAGPGAFAVAFSPHHSRELRGYFDHAHNDHAEFLIETGVIGYGLLAAVAIVTLAHGLAVMRRRRDPHAGALAFCGSMALVSLTIHGLAEFNLRVPAIPATLLVLMALALSCSANSSRKNGGHNSTVQGDAAFGHSAGARA